MNIKKAVITAAGRHQRTLPLQTLIDRDGTEKSVLGILVEEALSAGIEEIAVVVVPGDEAPYANALRAAGGHSSRLHFIAQDQPLGYGHAVFCARDFVGDAPFLHMVGDHLHVSGDDQTCARQLVELAQAEACAVSAVQATRESLLPYFGAVGGKHVPGRQDVVVVETVLEKPTPTEAELRLIVPGLRAGHYLCFFGMHVLTPTVMAILEQQVAQAGAPQNGARGVTLSGALAVLATRVKYLAFDAGTRARRYDVGVKYGLLTAQLALALNGNDRVQVLARLLELLAQRELAAPRR